MAAGKNPRRPKTLSEERLKSVLELSSDWYWEQDKNLRFTLFSGKTFGEAGFESASLIGRTRWEIPGARFEPGERLAVQAKLDARQPFTDHEYEVVGPDGFARHISASGVPVLDDSGRFAGYRGIAKDITERKRAEELQSLEHAVAHSIAQAESVTAAMTAVIRAICETESWECGRYFRPDNEASVLRFGESWGVPEPAIQEFIERSHGINHRQGSGLMGRVWQSGQPLWVADVTKDSRALRAGFTDDLGIRGGFVFPVKSEGKTIGVLAFNSRQVREPDERLLKAILAIGSHIGQFLERKRAEEEQRRFRAAMDASADLMLLIDRSSMRYIDVNDAACRALGYTREELLTLGPQDIFSKSREELAQLYDRMFAGELVAPTVEGVYRCKDGSQLPIEAYPRAVRSAAGDIIVSIARDVTARQREEKLLAMEHAVTRCLAETESASAGLQTAIQVVCESEGWELGRYFSIDEKAGVLRFAQAWGTNDDKVKHYIEGSRDLTYAPGVGLAGRAWQSGQPQWAADMGKDPRIAQRALAQDSDMHGAFVFPVISAGKTIGVLAFNSRKVREQEKRLSQAIHVIGSQIGQFVQRKQAEEGVRQNEERFRSLTVLSSDMYWEQDDQFRFTSMSGTGSERVNVKTFPAIGKKRWEQNYVNMTADAWAEHIALLEAHKPFRDMELCRLDETGKKIWISISGEPVFDSSGVVRGYRGVGKDISERKQDEERIHFLANHDALTSLPNRAMFNDVLALAIQNARRYDRNFAVLFIDLDRFKNINDTLGHEAGDRLLQEMGARLTQTVRASDVVARLGGDEFVVLVQEVSEAKQVEAVARKVLFTLVKPMVIQRQECRVTASIGICMFPAEAQDEHALMKNADIAMYRAKEDGKNTYKFYSEEMNIHSFERLALETSLRRGLERSEFVLHYQAKLDLHTGKINGVEALVRWQHPDLGMVPPAQFIPLAEETGLIVPLGKWVLHTACAQNVAWLFGVGYSSLTHLKRFPIDTLKVDRSFIRDLPQNAEDKALTEAIIAMGKSLNLTVVAEGVETQEQQTFLRDRACDEMQGFFFSKPIPSGEFAELLRLHIKG